MRVFIGFDSREEAAAEVAAKTLREVTNGEIEPEFLRADKLADQGLLWRVTDKRGSQAYDLVSNAPKSTEFAISRFLTPIICQTGYALFVDCDVVLREDPRNMLREVNAQHAVSVVQHDYLPSNTLKMVDQTQTVYPRKNWSSVMLFNCEHPANRRLSIRDVNERPGRDLHRFYWLHDREIGSLHPRWNWLVDVQPRPERIGIAHMTLGGPWLPGWQGGSFDDDWRNCYGQELDQVSHPKTGEPSQIPRREEGREDPGSEARGC